MHIKSLGNSSGEKKKKPKLLTREGESDCFRFFNSHTLCQQNVWKEGEDGRRENWLETEPVELTDGSDRNVRERTESRMTWATRRMELPFDDVDCGRKRFGAGNKLNSLYIWHFNYLLMIYVESWAGSHIKNLEFKTEVWVRNKYFKIISI